MILPVLFIAAGLIAIVATGVFLFELFRAPVALEDEDGFRSLEATAPANPAMREPPAANGIGYDNAAANVPLSVV